MDLYNKTNSIAFKLFTEMTEESNAYAVWDENSKEYLATNDIELAKKRAIDLSAQKKNNLFFVMDMEEVTGQGMNNEDPLDNEHYDKTVLFSYMNGKEEDTGGVNEEVPQDADEGTEIAEEDEKKEKSAVPVKQEMTFLREFKPHFRQGEKVEMVKEGSKIKLFKKGIDGANPVEINEKQAQEYFGHKFNEAGIIGKTTAAVASGVAGVAKDLAVGIYRGIYKGIKGNTPEEQKKIDNLAKTITLMKQVFQDNNLDFTEKQIGNLMERIIKKNPPKGQEAKTDSATAAGTDADVEKELGAGAGLEEEGFKPPKAKFVEKFKIKKAKKMKTFRGGHAGSGESAPKE